VPANRDAELARLRADQSAASDSVSCEACEQRLGRRGACGSRSAEARHPDRDGGECVAHHSRVAYVGPMPDHRNVLIERISRLGDVNDPETPVPLVTLEEFFEGNDDFGSIGCNFYPDQPAPAEFYAFFRAIRARPSVAEVRVQVTQHDDPKGWPFSDTIWIITSESPQTVAAWLGERFAADEIFAGLHTDRPYEPIPIPDGMSAVGVWWD